MGFRKASLQVRRQRTGGNGFSNFFRAVEQIGQAQLVARQNPLGLGFNQSRRKPRQNRRHASQQFLVDHGHLREVRDFSRSAGVNERRQQVVLHHGTKQHIRVETLRSPFNPVQQLSVRDRSEEHTSELQSRQ